MVQELIEECPLEDRSTSVAEWESRSAGPDPKGEFVRDRECLREECRLVVEYSELAFEREVFQRV
jgi:hypothetical protein